MNKVKEMYLVTNGGCFNLYYRSKAAAESELSRYSPAAGLKIVPLLVIPACQKPEQGEAEIKCGCGEKIEIVLGEMTEHYEHGITIRAEREYIFTCKKCDVEIKIKIDELCQGEPEAIAAFHLATNQDKLDAQAKEIKGNNAKFTDFGIEIDRLDAKIQTLEFENGVLKTQIKTNYCDDCPNINQITTLKAENEKMKKALSEILEIHGWRLANLTSNYCDKTMDICKKALKGEK